MWQHNRFRRGRPPWWPDEEPWPPTGPPQLLAWREMRGRFFWRLGAFLGLLFIFTCGGFTLLFWLTASLLGMVNVPDGAVAAARMGGILALLLGVVGLALAGRALRRLAMPIGDLIEAAGRVEEGDYATRVPERGPREVRALAHAFNSMTSRLQTHEQQRRNLLADVTHELRTPLTVIQGSLEGLVDGIYPLDAQHLTPILDETQILARLIDDLGTLALAEAGALKLQKEPTDLAALINETVSSFRPQAASARIDLRAEVAPNLPALELDGVRVREVFTNLIANALRYTPRGGTITISASFTAGDKHIICAVSDSGAGISSQDLPHIFDRFYKSQDSRGTGLGLAIAKNLVTAHGGEMTAQSDVGHGTTIRFTLPL